MDRDLHQPPGAVAQADQVALVVEHVELDDRGRRSGPPKPGVPAARERLEQRAVDAGLAEHARVEVAADAAMVERHHQHVGIGPAAEAGAVLDAAIGVARVDVRGPQLGLQLELDADIGMIEHMSADRKVLDHLDAVGSQMLGRSDARAQQNRRGVECPSREHDLCCEEILPFAVGTRAHADGAPALEQHPVDQAVAPDLQVGRPRAGSR